MAKNKKKNKLIIGLSSTMLGAMVLAASPTAYASEPIVDTDSVDSNEMVDIVDDYYNNVITDDIESTEKKAADEQSDISNNDQSSDEETPQTDDDTPAKEQTDNPEIEAELSVSEHPSATTDEVALVGSVTEEKTSTEDTTERFETNNIQAALDETEEVSSDVKEDPASEVISEEKPAEDTTETSQKENSTPAVEDPSIETEKIETTAIAETTSQNDEVATDDESLKETPAGDEPLKEDPRAGDAPLGEEGLPKTKEASELPETAEGAQLPAAEEGEEEPKIQTLAAGDAPLTEEGAELPLVEEGAPIAPGESVKDSEDIVKNANAYNLKSEVPKDYTKVNDAISYRLVKANPQYRDPGYFEMAIRVDTTNRAIDDLYYSDTFNTSNGVLDVSSIKFKSEGENIAGTADTVNFKPTSDLIKTKSGRSLLNLNYGMSEQDLQTINEKKDVIYFSISGRYTTPPKENDSQFGTTSSVTGHQIPYPNENNNGDIISVDKSSVNGNDRLEDIPVTEKYPDRGIKNCLYDTGITVNNVGEEDKNRITGRVYTKSGKELDNVRVFFDGNSVKLKLPEGAIKDENSVFNKDLKDYKDLEVELFIRPRTDDEISTLYKDYGGLEPDAPDVKSGSKSITNEIANGTGTDTTTETLPVNTYNRVRYDNFNTLGRFEISLDDQSNYDVTYWKDGKDTTDKVNRLTAGKTSTIEEKYNAYKSVLKSDLDAALKDEIAERKLDTNNLTEVGENSYVNEDGWKVDIDEEAKTFNVTPPLNAKKGDEISLSVEFKFTNGSTKDFPLIFRVNKEAIETPKYEIKEDEPNTDINSTPTYDEDPDTVQPDRIELESRYHEDDHGNLWKVTIDEETGNITATTPNEVIGEYTLRVPVTAYYKDPVKVDENGEPIYHTRRTYAEFKTQATKPYERTYTEKEPISYPVEIQQDPNLENGKQEIVQQGKDGVKEVTYNQKYNNDGTKDGAPTVVGEKVLTEARTHIIKVGTKTENTKKITETIPFDYRVEYDENLEAEKYVIEPGANGTKTTTWNIVNSEIVGEPTVEKTDPIQGVIRVGSKDFTGDVTHKDKEEIPYKVITKENPDLAVGTTRVTTPGEVGTKEVTYTVPVRNGALDSQDGKQITSTEEVIKEAVDEVVEIGTKSIEERVEIPFNTEYKYDETLKAGEIVEETPGKNGTNKVVTSYDPATKSAKMTEEVVTAPTNRVVRVGGMTNGTETVTEKVPFEVEIRENSALKKGDYKVIQDGVVGEKEKILTIENSTVTNTTEGRTITEAKNQIIEVGSADFTGKVTHEVTHEVPFTVRIVEDPTMAPGTHKVVTEGQAGSKTTRYTQNIKNGAADGDLKSEEIVTDTTKAPVEEVIHIGTAAVNSENTSTSGDIPVDITYTYDPTKERGTAEKGAFTPGKVETKIVNQYNPETGTIETTTEETVTNATQEIIVGTKDYTGTFTHEETKVTPFKTEIVHDPNLKAGETVTDQTGVNGVETRTITQKFTNGNIAEKSYSDWTQESAVQNEIIRVGSLTEGTKKHEEAIPFDYKVEYDPTIPAGEYKITQEGKDGKRTTEWTIENSKVVGDPTVTEEAPVNAIIKVGNKDFTGQATHTEEFTIPYKVEIRERADLPVGTRNTIQEGVDGSYTITYKQDIKNGDTVGELTKERTEVTPVQNQIIEIGTKAVDPRVDNYNYEVQPVIDYVYDDTLEKGEVVEGAVTPGEVKTVITTTRDPQTGELVTKEEKIVTPARQEIRVGTKDYTGEITYTEREFVDYETIIKVDNTKAPGYKDIEQEGKVGVIERDVTRLITNGTAGDPTYSKDRVTPKQDQIITVGALTEGTNSYVSDIPFAYTVEYDESIPAGEYRIEKPGVVGKKRTTWTVRNSEVVETNEEIITNKEDAIIKVSSKAFAGTVTNTVTQQLPYEIEIVESSELPVGTRYVRQEGEAGSVDITYSQDVKNGAADGDVTATESNRVEPKKQIIVVGTKPIDTSVKPEITIEKDPNLAAGEVEVGEIVPGKVVTTTEKSIDPLTGKEVVREVTTTTPATQTIKVGTKAYDGKVEYKEQRVTPFETEIIFDDSLAPGKEVVEQAGINKVEERTITQNYSNGTLTDKVEGEFTTATEGQKQVIRVGTMTNGVHSHEEKLPFGVKVEYSENIPAGQYEVVVDGKEGVRVTRWNIENSNVVGDPEVLEVPATDAIIRVGTKAFEGVIDHKVTEKIPFTIEFVENKDLALGETRVKEEGVDGSREVTYHVPVKNGEKDPTKEITSSEGTVTQPKVQIVEIGTKIPDAVSTNVGADNIGVDVVYEYDPNLDLGKTREGELTPGKVENTVTTVYNPETGKLETVENKKVTNAKQVIYIGTKALEGKQEFKVTQEIPFTTRYEYDPELDAGETEVVQKGVNGEKTVTYTAEARNGSVISHGVDEVVTKAPVEQIIKVGTKPSEPVNTIKETTTTKEQIPYTTIYKPSDELDAGEIRVETPGKMGVKNVTIYTEVVDGVEKVRTSENVETEPVAEVVLVGTRTNNPTTDVITKTTTETIPFKTITIEDPNLEVGTEIVDVDGVDGEKEITITIPSEISSPDDLVVKESIIKESTPKVVRVGTKKTSTRIEEKEVAVPYETEIILDDTLKDGEREVDQAGETGTDKITTVVTIVNGQDQDARVITTERTKDPVKEIVRVGTRRDGSHSYEEDIPFEVTIIEDENLKDGEYEIEKEGVVGKKTTTWEIVNSQVVAGSEKTTITKQAENAVVRVGTADHTGTVEYSTSEELPFEVEIVQNPDLAIGKHKVRQEGIVGSLDVTYEIDVVNGKASGEPKVKTSDRVAPVKQIIEIGTKPVEQIDNTITTPLQPDFKVIYDNTKDKGTVEVGQLTPGKVETKITQTFNPETGQMESKEETVVTNPTQTITIGTKDYTGEVKYTERVYEDYKTTIIQDPTLAADQQVVEKQGVVGIKEREVTRTITNGTASDPSYGEYTTIAEKQDQVIRVGTKTDGTHTVTEEIPFTYTINEVDTLKKGEYEVVTAGKNGSRTTEYKIENSKVVEGSANVTEETPATNAVINVGKGTLNGTHTITETEVVPFETKVEFDDSLAAGEQRVVTEGQNGSKSREVTLTIEDGKVVNTETGEYEEKQAPVNKVIKVGSLTEGEIEHSEKIPFNYEITYDETLKAGEVKTDVEGKVGTKTTYYIVKNSEVMKTYEDVVNPTNAKIRVGTKDYTGTITHTEEEAIPYKVIVRENSEMLLGTSRTVTEGKPGVKEVTYNIPVANGEQDATKEVTSSEKVTTAAVDQVIEVGTKAVDPVEKDVSETVDVVINYELDPNLQKGERRTGDLVPGKVENVVTTVYNPTTGKMETREDKKVSPAVQTIYIGSQDLTGPYNYEVEKTIPFITIYETDPELEAGKQEIIQNGENGTKVIKVIADLVNGKAENSQVSEEVTKEATPQIIKIGTKVDPAVDNNTEVTSTDSKELIPFEITYEYTDELPVGTTEVKTPGEFGEKTVTTYTKVVNGETIVEKEESTDKDPVTQVVRVGTKVEDPDVTNGDVSSDTITVEIPYTTYEMEDPNLEVGTVEEVRPGQNGVRTITVTVPIENGKAGDPIVKDEITTQAVEQIIKVGTKKTNTRTEVKETVIPFETEIVFDPELKDGESVVTQEGKNGIDTTTTVTTIVNGEDQANPEVTTVRTQEVQNQIIKVGTMRNGTHTHTEEIPFGYDFVNDPDLKDGEYKVEFAGKAGSRTTTWDIKNSEIVEDSKRVSEEKPQNAIIRIGTADHTGTVEYSTSEEIPFTVTIREDPNLAIGKHNVILEGKAGSKEVTYEVDVVNGKASGEPRIKTSKQVDPTNQIIEVGTKPVDNLEKEFTTDLEPEFNIVYDDTKDKGTVEVGQLLPGKVETKIVETYNPETGKIESKEEVVVTNPSQTITIGTKNLEGEQTTEVDKVIPFETRYVEDPELESGKQVIDQEGKNGKKTVTYYTKAIDGKFVNTDIKENIIDQPVEQIIRVGTKEVKETTEVRTNVTKEPIAFETEYIKDPELATGEYVETQTGEYGEKTITTTTKIVNGQETSNSSEEITKQPTNRIVRIGTKVDRQTKDVVGEETTIIPYKTTIIYDPTLKAGEKVVGKQGENGERKITVTVPVKDGVAGEPVVKTEDIKLPVDEVIRVGTRDDSSNFVSNTNIITESIPYETRYEEDSNLPVGETRVETPGQFGSKTTTTSTTIVNGEAKTATDEIVTKDPVTQVVKVGTKLNEIPGQSLETSKTEEIPFTTIIRENDKMEVGSSKVVQNGENGETTIKTTVNVENGIAGKPEITTTTTKEAKARIIEVGTKPVVEEVTDQTPFETEVIFDDTLPLGEKRVSGGLAGEKVTTITHTYENGQIVTRKEDKVTKESSKQIVRVGTKAEPGETRNVEKTVEVEIPYTTEIIYDNSLPAGTTREEQAGKAGTRTITVKVPVSEGKALEPEVNENKVTTDPTPRILRVGTMSTDTVTTVTETVKPFATKVLYDDTMPKGISKVTQEGKNGIETRTIVATVINGITQENPAVKVSQTEPVDQIITVGTKCEDKVTTIDTVVEKIDPFDVIIKYDDTMEKGTEKVVTEGKNGIVEETQTVTVTNGVAGDPKVTNTKIIQDKVDKVIKVGTKCPENPTTPENPKGETKDVVSTTIVEIPFDTEIIEDDTIEAGRVIEQQAGQKGERTITSTVTIKDGVSSEPKITNVITKQPIKRIVRVGIKKTSTNPTPERIVTTEKIPYDTIEVKDNTLDEGQIVIVQKGQEGEKSIIRIGDELIEEITKQPRNEIVRVGTKKKGNSIPWTEIEDNAKNVIPATPIEDNAKNVIPATPIEDIAKPIEKEEGGNKQPSKPEQPEDNNTSPSVPEKTEDNPVRPQPEEPSEDTHEKPSVDTEDEGRTDGNSDNNPNRGEENTGEEYKPSDDGKENQGETDKKGQEVDPEFTNPDKHGDVTDPEFTIEDDSNPAVVVPTRVEKIDSNKITKSSTNPKTGIGSSTKVIATLAGSMAGLLASKKKKEDEE